MLRWPGKSELGKMGRVASMKRHDVDRWYRVTFSLASPSYFFGVAAEYWTDFKAVG